MDEPKGKRAKKPRAGDRHQKTRTVRIRSQFNGPLDAAAEELAQDTTQFVNDAIREKLERMGKWPIK